MKFLYSLTLLFAVSSALGGFQTHDIELKYSPIVIDGDISDWNNATWLDMNLVYEKRNTVTEAQLLERVQASYAVRFDLNSQSLTVAAKAKDATPLRSDSFINWNNQDHFQFFVAHPAANDLNIYFGDWFPTWQQRNAQQYCIGLDSAGTGGWATMENEVIQDALLPAGFDFASSFDGTWQYVEAKIPIFKEYGAYTGTATIAGGSLGAGDLIKFDALYVTANSSLPNDPAIGILEGSVANNTQQGKFNNPEQIAEHLLILPEPLSLSMLAGGFLLVRKRG